MGSYCDMCAHVILSLVESSHISVYAPARARSLHFSGSSPDFPGEYQLHLIFLYHFISKFCRFIPAIVQEWPQIDLPLPFVSRISARHIPWHLRT